MRIRVAAPLALLLSLPSFARAQQGDAEPETPPGENAAPPLSPSNVPPPASPELPSAGATTSSTAAASDDDDAPAVPRVRRRRDPRAVIYTGGRLVIREPSGLVELTPSGLLQFDTYAYAGPGVVHYQRPNGTGLKAGVLPRRVRMELAGRIASKWFFLLGLQGGGEGDLANPDPRGAGFTVRPLNNVIGVDLAPMLKLQVGQFRVPFTMDNVTGIRWGEFMERSLTARVMGAPLVRDLGVMAWGGTDRSAIWWALGWFGGEGGNRASTDNRGDAIGRILFRPLWKHGKHLGQAHVGVSGRYGRRDRSYAQYDAPLMTTPGGYTFWSPVYGSGAGETHVQPSNDQSAIGAELFVPFCCIDLRGEFVAVRDGRREVFAASRNNTERAGTLSGYSWYVQATWWPLGPTRMVGAPGTWSPPSEDHSRERALAIAVRYEQLRAKYDSIDRSYRDDVLVDGVRRGQLDATTTNIHVDVVQAAATYWATRHIRVTAQWSLFRFPGVPGVDNQATAPGSKPNNAEERRAEARTLHEISARVQVSF